MSASRSPWSFDRTHIDRISTPVPHSEDDYCREEHEDSDNGNDSDGNHFVERDNVDNMEHTAPNIAQRR